MDREDLLSRMTRIWVDVLEIESLSIDDDFFDLGGDSLLALKIASAAAAEGLPVRPSEVLRRLTVRELVDALEDPALSGR